MAYTVTFQKKGVQGDERVHALDITADAATQNVDSGLAYINYISVGIKSASTAAIKVYPNSGAGGTSLAGFLGISGAVSGDEFFVVCYGR